MEVFVFFDYLKLLWFFRWWSVVITSRSFEKQFDCARIKMTRGNQRERDRERAAARAKQTKQRDDGLTPDQRRERDAKALQEKTARKMGEQGGTSSGQSSSSSSSSQTTKK